MELIKNESKLICHDCGCQIKTNEKNEIVDGFELVYNSAGKKIKIFKCKECFTKSKALRNYQSCEVYSRVVGYLRPIQQWHKGKEEEYLERKEYKTT